MCLFLSQAFCQHYTEGSGCLPYYETCFNPSDSIVIAFQEIVARPLIHDYLVSMNCPQEMGVTCVPFADLSSGHGARGAHFCS